MPDNGRIWLILCGPASVGVMGRGFWKKRKRVLRMTELEVCVSGLVDREAPSVVRVRVMPLPVTAWWWCLFPPDLMSEITSFLQGGCEYV